MCRKPPPEAVSLFNHSLKGNALFSRWHLTDEASKSPEDNRCTAQPSALGRNIHIKTFRKPKFVFMATAIKCYFSKKQFLGFNLSHALEILSHMLQSVVYWRSVQVIATLKISHLRNIWVSTHLCFLDDNVLCRSSISLTTSPGEAVSVNLHRKWQIRSLRPQDPWDSWGRDLSITFLNPTKDWICQAAPPFPFSRNCDASHTHTKKKTTKQHTQNMLMLHKTGSVLGTTNFVTKQGGACFWPILFVLYHCRVWSFQKAVAFYILLPLKASPTKMSILWRGRNYALSLKPTLCDVLQERCILTENKTIIISPWLFPFSSNHSNSSSWY